MLKKMFFSFSHQTEFNYFIEILCHETPHELKNRSLCCTYTQVWIDIMKRNWHLLPIPIALWTKCKSLMTKFEIYFVSLIESQVLFASKETLTFNISSMLATEAFYKYAVVLQWW